MRIAMVASEAAPFVKTGGLGDVMQALPNALSKLKGNEICLFLPYYKRIKEDPAVETEQVGSFSMELAWRESYVGILRLKSRRKKLQVYFIDNDYYFGARSTIYGDFDDGERFAYFSKAVMAALYFLDFKPDILHCHDWQAAMTPAYLRALYHDWCPQTKLVFTIHNVEYQGWADASFFDNILGLPDEYRASLTFDGAINMMKGAIELSDIVTTVSKSYAEELRYPYYAHRLDGVLRNAWLWGITNGIDTDVFDPETDCALSANYSAADMSGKWVNKRALREEMGLSTDTDAPILGMVTRLAGHKGIDLLCYIGQRLMEREIQLVIVGTGEKQYEYALSALARQYPGRIAVSMRAAICISCRRSPSRAACPSSLPCITAPCPSSPRPVACATPSRPTIPKRVRAAALPSRATTPMISSAPSTAQQACITATATHGTGWPAMIWSVTSAGRSRPTNICSCTANCSTASSKNHYFKR